MPNPPKAGARRKPLCGKGFDTPPKGAVCSHFTLLGGEHFTPHPRGSSKSSYSKGLRQEPPVRGVKSLHPRRGVVASHLGRGGALLILRLSINSSTRRTHPREGTTTEGFGTPPSEGVLY